MIQDPKLDECFMDWLDTDETLDQLYSNLEEFQRQERYQFKKQVTPAAVW
jgi:hypothetical protein